jgi:hypothetical protein
MWDAGFRACELVFCGFRLQAEDLRLSLAFHLKVEATPIHVFAGFALWKRSRGLAMPYSRAASEPSGYPSPRMF